MTDEQFGWWLAGLVDGEGHFGVTRYSTAKRPGPYYRAVFRVTSTAADRNVLEMAHERTGWGRIYEYAGHGNAQLDYVVWTTTTKDVGRVADFFERYPLQSKKRHDFEMWVPAARAQVARVQVGRKRDEVAAAIMAEVYEAFRAMDRGGRRR
jgi:hypothetical protein